MPVDRNNPGSLIGCLFFHAQKDPEHDAIVTPGLRLTYTQLASVIPAQAKILTDAGISADSVIGIKCADEGSCGPDGNDNDCLVCIAANGQDPEPQGCVEEAAACE